ncbi:MAG: hypothetical protein AB7Q27_19340, partial [Acidimicrobiia bacterium]
ADPTDWTLTATPLTEPPDTYADDYYALGPSGVDSGSGVSEYVVPDMTYVLSEAGGDPDYAQVVEDGDPAEPGTEPPHPDATVSWFCAELDTDGNEVGWTTQGLLGTITVPLGTHLQCTAVNQTALLTLIKQVDNQFGGTATPSDWTLTATPTGDVPPGVLPKSVTGSPGGVEVAVRPGVAYALTEAGPAGYTLDPDPIVCTINTVNQVAGNILLLAAGDSAACTFVNTQRPPPTTTSLPPTTTTTISGGIPTSTTPAPNLPATGRNIMPTAAWSLLLLGVGTTLIQLARRTRHRPSGERSREQCRSWPGCRLDQRSASNHGMPPASAGRPR